LSFHRKSLIKGTRPRTFRRTDPFSPYYGYRKRGKKKDFTYLIIGVLILFLIIIWLKIPRFMVIAVVQGKQVAYLPSEKYAKKAIAQFIKIKAGDGQNKIQLKQNYKFIKVPLVKNKKFDFEKEKIKFLSALTILIPAKVFFANKKPIFACLDAARAKNIIEQFKKNNEVKKGEPVELFLKENISIKNYLIPIQKLKTSEQIKLLFSARDRFYYKVKKGDTAVSIAQKFGTTASAIKNANPKINIHNLQIGQILVIKKNQPPLTVICRRKITSLVEIPYNIIVKEDKGAPVSESRIQQEGKNGLVKVTEIVTYENKEEKYRKIISEQIIRKSIPQVRYKGTARE